MTWTFDYSAIFAIGSLTIALAGASIYFIGALYTYGVESEYNKAGYPVKHNSITHYTNGLLFLGYSVIFFSVLSFLLLILIYFVILIPPSVHPSYYLFMEINKHIYTIYFIDLFAQFLVLLWAFFQISNLRDIKANSNGFFIVKCILLSYPSIFALICIANFIIGILNTIINGESVSLNSVALFVAPIIFVFLTLSFLSGVCGSANAIITISKLKPVKRIVMHFTDGQTLEGDELNYVDGYYKLKKSESSDNKETNFIIYEDKIHHIERINED